MNAQLSRYFNWTNYSIIIGLTVIWGIMFLCYPYLLLPINYQEITISQPQFRYERTKNSKYITLIEQSPKYNRYAMNCNYLNNGVYNLCAERSQIKAISKINALAMSNDLYGKENSLVIKSLSFKDTNNINHLFLVNQSSINGYMSYYRDNQLLARIILLMSYAGLFGYFIVGIMIYFYQRIKNNPFHS